MVYHKKTSRCIIYEQCVASMNVRIHKKEKIKVVMKNRLVEFIQQEMRILHAKLLLEHS